MNRALPRHSAPSVGCAIVFGVGLALAGSVVAANDWPCGSGGPCDTPHDGLGCSWNACCVAVCAFDPSCCDVAWSENCVLWSTELCADIPCPNDGPCGAAHEDTGCDDETCCFLVCRIDPFCCGGRWDAVCAAEALQLCGVAPCELVIPDEARSDGEECAERTNDGCNMAAPAFDTIACGEMVTGYITSSAPRDTDWFAISTNRPTTLRATLTPEFPGEVILVQGPCQATRVHGVRNASGCVPGTLDIDVPAGDWWIVVSVASEFRAIHRGMPCPNPKDPDAPVPAWGNRYLLTMECDDPTTPLFGDLNGDGVVDAADLGLLLGAWGPCAGCVADLDGNGVVDAADLGLLLGAWTG